MLKLGSAKMIDGVLLQRTLPCGAYLLALHAWVHASTHTCLWQACVSASSDQLLAEQTLSQAPHCSTQHSKFPNVPLPCGFFIFDNSVNAPLRAPSVHELTA